MTMQVLHSHILSKQELQPGLHGAHMHLVVQDTPSSAPRGQSLWVTVYANTTDIDTQLHQEAADIAARLYQVDSYLYAAVVGGTSEGEQCC